MMLPPLRPMREAPKAGAILAMVLSGQTFEVRWDKAEELWKGYEWTSSRGLRFEARDFLGWWPMPEVTS